MKLKITDCFTTLPEEWLDIAVNDKIDLEKAFASRLFDEHYYWILYRRTKVDVNYDFIGFQIAKGTFNWERDSPYLLKYAIKHFKTEYFNWKDFSWLVDMCYPHLNKTKIENTDVNVVNNGTVEDLIQEIKTKFKINPNIIELDKTLSGGAIFISSDRISISDNPKYTVYGYSWEFGFVNLPGVLEEIRNPFTGVENIEKLVLSEVPNVDQYQFFMVEEVNFTSKSWRLYKAPDFQQYKIKADNEDKKRWKKWFSSEEPETEQEEVKTFDFKLSRFHGRFLK